MPEEKANYDPALMAAIREEEKYLSQVAPKFDVELTDAQLDFLLWSLGYILAAADKMDDAHKHYIGEHHFAILPKLIGAKKRSSSG